MLSGVGIQPPEDVRGSPFLQFYGGDKTQDVVPGGDDRVLIHELLGFYHPARAVGAPARPKRIEILLFQVLDAGGETASQQVGDREDGLGKAMRVGGVDVAFDHVVTHEAINDICALAFRRAENQGMPEQVALIDEGVIPTRADQNRWTQSRSSMDMMRQG